MTTQEGIRSETARWPALRTPGSTMTATVFHEFGSPDVLQPHSLPVPHPLPGEVLVQVAAVSVGRLLDLSARAGTHPYARFTFPHVLGAEHAGVVAAVGADVTDLEVGQQVATFPVITCGECSVCRQGRDELCRRLEIIGTHRPGAYAEYVAVPATNLHPVPAGIDPVTACALALGGAVAMNQLTQAGLRPGSWVVVQAAPSALGSITALLAQQLGANVVATSRVAGKRAQLRQLGFEHVLDGTAADFADRILDLTGGVGADIVVDDIGDPRLWRNSQAALGRGGVLVSSGAFRGAEVPVNLQRLYSMGQQVLGVRTGNKASSRRLWDEVARGFRPPVAATFGLSEAAAAHRYLEDDLNVGRVVLVVGS
ncbi:MULTISPECIES: alcohol dehydrogenase catalytic domain-containing protein [unclassified Kribbella]|uniref:alcohol dehydrogenase catalytic domain-containing protein n=1 Tax=unclassified Kribbella TaxID=2644121 RepID=UPI0033FC2498